MWYNLGRWCTPATRIRFSGRFVHINNRMKTPFESFRTFVSEEFRNGFVPGFTKEQRFAWDKRKEDLRRARAEGRDPRTVPFPKGFGMTLMANTGEFTDEFGTPNWKSLTDPANRVAHGRGGINPFRSALKYNRGDDSSIAQFSRPFTKENLSNPEDIHHALDQIVRFVNDNCGHPLSDDGVVRFVDDLRSEMIGVLTGRVAPREIRNTSANRNRINAEDTNRKVSEFKDKLENAKTPEEILRVFAPVLEFRARLERVRKELLRRRANISRAAFQLTEYTMNNTLRIYVTDPNAIFVEAIGTWEASEDGVGFGRDVDLSRAIRISLVRPDTDDESPEMRKLRGRMFLAGNGVDSKFDLERTRWGEFQKAVEKGRFRGTFSTGDFWVDVRFTRRKDGTRDELDDIVDEFSPVGPDYHGRVKLLPGNESHWQPREDDDIGMSEVSAPAMDEEKFPTEGSAEAVDVLLNVMQKFGMNISVVRTRLERDFRSVNAYSLQRNSGEEKSTDKFMRYLQKLARYELIKEYHKRKSTRRESDILDFQASAVAQLVCMQVGYGLAADTANRDVQRLFYDGLFNLQDPKATEEAAEALVVSADIASEITSALLDTLTRRRRAKHENFD